VTSYDYISADNHLDTHWIPANLWRDRLPAKFREQGPQVKETDDGSYWVWEDRRHDGSAAGSSNAKFLEQFRSQGVTIEDGALPPSDPKYLIEHMDMSRIYASVIFSAVRKWDVRDPELCKAVYRAFNDYAVEMNEVSPDRVIMLPALPTQFPEECVAEFDRLVKQGVRGFEFPPFDVAKPAYDEIWEPLWARANEAGITLCTHIGGPAASAIPPSGRGANLAFLSTAPFNLTNICAELIFAGVFERHPNLKFLFAECRIGWVPFLMQWMDRQTIERAPDPVVPLKMLPSEYAKRNCGFTFEEDYMGTELMKLDWNELGKMAVWGSDYPHTQGTWPNVSGPINKMFEGIDAETKRNVLWTRAADMFEIKGP
jgi:predicted TIM-barrel fold metal-dependent hydrolase